MFFTKRNWKNRQCEYHNRRKLAKVAGKQDEYEVTRVEGLVMEEGDAFDQNNMNDMESRIASGFDAAEKALGGKASAEEVNRAQRTADNAGKAAQTAQRTADAAVKSAQTAQRTADNALPGSSARDFLRVVSWDAGTGTLRTTKGV